MKEGGEDKLNENLEILTWQVEKNIRNTPSVKNNCCLYEPIPIKTWSKSQC
jgi:hypothetical protein